MSGNNTGKENLRDYNSIAGLKADQLKKLCKLHGIDIKLPKKARIVLLCHVLGISTTGKVKSLNSDYNNCLSNNQKEELNRITPAYMCQIDGWVNSLTSLPDIEESTVKKYLVNTNVLSTNDARTYKISRPYALRQFVHSIMFNDNNGSDNFCIVKAQCNPSQSTNHDEVKVVYTILDKYTGDPYGGFCTCTVGHSERCGHIGALLFRLAELQATGAIEGPSCTDVLCSWSDPKSCKAEPTRFQDLKIKKTNTTTIRRTADDYGHKVSNSSPPTYDEVVELRASLIAATHHLGQYCPAVHILNCNRFKTENAEKEIVNIYTELPEHLHADSEAIVPAKEVVVKTTPVTIPQLVRKQYNNVNEDGFFEASQKLFNDAINMNIDINKINEITKGQANNQEWFEQRLGAITATKFAAVIKANEKQKDCKSLVKDILEYKKDKLKNVPAIKWGRKNESKARMAYINKFERYHKDFNVEESGLIVYKNCNFIRGSPDGLVNCACHGQFLLEIKCPFSARMLTVNEAIDQGKIRYLEKVKGHLQLKKDTSDGYYAQVQGLMGITGVNRCQFLIWTTRDMVVVNVNLDNDFFLNQIVTSCKAVFKKHVVPKLLLKELSDDASCTEQETEVFIATPLVTSQNQKMCEQPRKNSKKSPKSPKIVLPASKKSKKSTTSAELILSETTSLYKCAVCHKVLPEDNIAPDNSNASVGCDCPNCGGCDIWMCWPCARYDQEWADSCCNWYCIECTRECDIVY